MIHRCLLFIVSDRDRLGESSHPRKTGRGDALGRHGPENGASRWMSESAQRDTGLIALASFYRFI